MADEKNAIFNKSFPKTIQISLPKVFLFLWGNLIICSLVLKLPPYGNHTLSAPDFFWENLLLAIFIWSSMVFAIRKSKKGKKSTSFLAAIVNSSPDGIVGFTNEGVINSWNKGAEIIFGYTADEMMGQPFLKYVEMVVPERFQKDSVDRFSQLTKTGNSVFRVEAIRCHKDGHEINVFMTVTSILDAKGNVIGQGGIIRDITEKKKVEEDYKTQEAQLRVAQKMDAIGRLAGGIAHDFNNLLVVVRSNSEFLLEKINRKDFGWNELTEIQDAAQHGSDLTRQILTFSNKQMSDFETLNLNEITSRLKSMLNRLLYDHIEMFLFQEKNLKSIQADKTQIEQVILNLAINARDAMPNGGHLLLETQNVEVKPSEKNGKIPEGAYVRISVKDTGVGMSEEVQKHIFEPFFTTKGNKGTGLGLATVYRIVQQMKGHIVVQSTLGVGTEFSIYFTAVDSSEGAPAFPRCVSLDTNGTEIVLVVEDDEPVRRILVKTLRGKGYGVLEAANGAEALLVAENYEEPIDLLLTDIMMPKMNGRDLAEKLVNLIPALKVLFISGYPNDVLDGQCNIPRDFIFLQKPFPSTDLFQKIREVLEGKIIKSK